ncbi:hypothetical protein ACVRYP_05540 [Streptococcus rifensis]
MPNRYKWTFVLTILVTAALWIWTPPSNPNWIKNLIFAGAILYQLLLYLYFKRIPLADSKETYFGLTEKLYAVTLFTAFAIYTKGIWALTPDTDPVWLKHLVLGIGLTVLAVFALYFLFKPIDEKPDDRFYMNLAKAASLTLVLVVVSLMLLTIVTFFRSLTITAGMVLIFGGAIIFAFDLAFFYFEKRGG